MWARSSSSSGRSSGSRASRRSRSGQLALGFGRGHLVAKERTELLYAVRRMSRTPVTNHSRIKEKAIKTTRTNEIINGQQN